MSKSHFKITKDDSVELILSENRDSAVFYGLILTVVGLAFLTPLFYTFEPSFFNTFKTWLLPFLSIFFLLPWGLGFLVPSGKLTFNLQEKFVLILIGPRKLLQKPKKIAFRDIQRVTIIGKRRFSFKIHYTVLIVFKSWFILPFLVENSLEKQKAILLGRKLSEAMNCDIKYGRYLNDMKNYPEDVV